MAKKAENVPVPSEPATPKAAPGAGSSEPQAEPKAAAPPTSTASPMQPPHMPFGPAGQFQMPPQAAAGMPQPWFPMMPTTAEGSAMPMGTPMMSPAVYQQMMSAFIMGMRQAGSNLSSSWGVVTDSSQEPPGKGKGGKGYERPSAPSRGRGPTRGRATGKGRSRGGRGAAKASVPAKQEVKKESKGSGKPGGVPDDFDSDPSEYTYEWVEENPEEETITDDPSVRPSTLEEGSMASDRPRLESRRAKSEPRNRRRDVRDGGSHRSSDRQSRRGREGRDRHRRRREDGSRDRRRRHESRERPPTPRDVRDEYLPERHRHDPATPQGSDLGSSSGGTSLLQNLLRDHARRGAERGGPRSNLSNVRLEMFKGGRSTYKEWRKTIEAQRALYKLTEPELATLIYLSTSGEPRDVLNQLEIPELQEEGGLGRVLKLLDDTYGTRAEERFEEKQEAFLTYRRQHGVAMGAYLANLKRMKSEYLKEDEHTRISDKAFAQRMLTRAGLTKKERMEVFFAAGGSYDSKAIEQVLRFRCATLHEEEKEKYGHARRPHRSHRPQRGYGSQYRQRPRRSSAHWADHEGNPADEDEDYELEEEDEDLDNEDLEQETLEASEHYDAYYQNWDDEEWQRPEEEYGSWEWNSNDDWDWDESWSRDELRDAYVAGWSAKAQSAGMRKARGYHRASSSKGSSKGSKGSKRKRKG